MPTQPAFRLRPPSTTAAIFERGPETREPIQATGIPFLLVRVYLAGLGLFGGNLAQCPAVFEIWFGFIGFRIDC